MTELGHVLERTVLICARRATVFRYFTDPERFAAWWGQGSHIEGRPGGPVRIRYPNGETASGQVLELVENERVVFSYGYDGPGKPIPPGGSRVTVTLAEQPRGTLLTLRHEVASAEVRDHHVQGWRYQLALFANVVAADQHSAVAAAVDRYFAAWGEPDTARRRAVLGVVVTEDVQFHDAFSCTDGRDDLDAHLAAAQVYMPGVKLLREGDVRQCQGTALVEWAAKGADGEPRGRGTNVFDLAPDGRIARVVGLWTN